MIEVLDPTHEDDPAGLVLADRLPSLDGATIGIVSNGKQGTRRFFEALGRELTERYGAAEIVVRTKTNYSAPAGPDIIDEAKRWNALVAGVGD